MLSIKESFAILGIEATKEKKAIKKAYAGLVKEVHPEDDPKEWRRLHDAYKRAVDYAEESAETEYTAFGYAEHGRLEIQTEPSPEREDDAAEGNRLDTLFHEIEDESFHKAVEAALYMRDALGFSHPTSIKKYGLWSERWKEFLEGALFDQASTDQRFWDMAMEYMKEEEISIEVLKMLEPKLKELVERPEMMNEETEAVLKDLLDITYKARSAFSKRTFVILIMAGWVIYMIVFFIRANLFPV